MRPWPSRCRLYYLLGAPSPESHYLVQAVLAAARRIKRLRRGSVARLFPSELLPRPPGPPVSPQASLPAYWHGLSPLARARNRKRAAAAPHLALMHDAANRIDDTCKGLKENK